MSTSSKVTTPPLPTTDGVGLTQSERRFRAIFEQAAVGVAQVATDGRWMDTNRRLCEFLGYTSDELRTLTFQDITHPDDVEMDLDQVRRMLAGEISTYSMEKRYRRKDGAFIWANLSVSLVRGDCGGPLYFISVVEDIDARKRAELSHSEALANLSLMVKASNTGLWDWDLNTNRVQFSRVWKSQLGYGEHEITDDFGEWERRVHPDDLAPTLERVRAYLADPSVPYEVEFRMRHKDGSWRWIYARGEVVRDTSGEPIRMLGCHIDITQRKESERALADSERRFRSLVEGADVIVWEADPATQRFTYVSPQAAALGYPIEAWFTPGFWYNTMHPDDRDEARAYHLSETSAARNHQLNYRILAADGRTVWVKDVVNIEVSASGKEPLLVRGVLIDITESKKMEERVRASEAFLRSAIDALAAHTVVVDRAGRIVSVNRAWREFAERNGGTGRDVLEGADYLAACDRASAQSAEAGVIAAALRAVLAGGTPTGPIEYACHSPSERRWFQACVSGFEQGDQRFAVVAHQDITAVRLAAERESRVRQIETVATIAAGVAHEFNSLLMAAAIQMHRHSTACAIPDDATSAAARALVDQARSLAAALLDLYSEPERNEPKLLSLYPWLPETVTRLGVALPSVIRITTEVELDLPEVIAHPLGLEQVLRNLLINAANAMGETGEIHVRAGAVVIEGRPMVEVRVSDDGTGVPVEDRDRIFEPGFTTHARSHRAGLGLAIAARLLEQFGGSIAYGPNTPRGSTFVVRLRAREGDDA
jgi:two-component system cell cycle sensor histidine kinase/response regulator CckA